MAHADMMPVEDLLVYNGFEGQDTWSSGGLEMTEHTLTQTKEALRDAKHWLDIASTCILDCFSHGTPGHGHFEATRSIFTRLAVVYKELHLPELSKVVADLEETFTLYEGLDDTTFKKHAKAIEKQVCEQAEHAALVSKLHIRLWKDLTGLCSDIEKHIEHLAANAESKNDEALRMLEGSEKERKCHEDAAYNWNIAQYVGACIAGGVATCAAAASRMDCTHAIDVGFIVGTFMGCYFHMRKNKEYERIKVTNSITSKGIQQIAATKEAKESLKAANMMKAKMMKALEEFTAAIKQVTRIFSVLYTDVASLSKNIMSASDQLDNMVLSHLNMLKKHNKVIVRACREYVHLETDVQARCMAIVVLDSDDLQQNKQMWDDEQTTHQKEYMLPLLSW